VRSSSCTGVDGVACLSAFADGASCFALPAEDLRTQLVVVGVMLDDMLVRSSKLDASGKGA
jgi:hypothetical protein